MHKQLLSFALIITLGIAHSTQAFNPAETLATEIKISLKKFGGMTLDAISLAALGATFLGIAALCVDLGRPELKANGLTLTVLGTVVTIVAAHYGLKLSKSATEDLLNYDTKKEDIRPLRYPQ